MRSCWPADGESAQLGVILKLQEENWGKIYLPFFIYIYITSTFIFPTIPKLVDTMLKECTWLYREGCHVCSCTPGGHCTTVCTPVNVSCIVFMYIFFSAFLPYFPILLWIWDQNVSRCLDCTRLFTLMSYCYDVIYLTWHLPCSG